MPEIVLVFAEDGSVRWKPAGGSRGAGKYNWVDGPACPIHGPWKVIPGGWSEKKQASYDAFYVCKDNDCPNRPGKRWVEANPADDGGWDYSEGQDDPLG